MLTAVNPHHSSAQHSFVNSLHIIRYLWVMFVSIFEEFEWTGEGLHLFIFHTPFFNSFIHSYTHSFISPCILSVHSSFHTLIRVEHHPPEESSPTTSTSAPNLIIRTATIIGSWKIIILQCKTLVRLGRNFYALHHTIDIELYSDQEYVNIRGSVEWRIYGHKNLGLISDFVCIS